MPVYVLSPCFLEKVDKGYFPDTLYVFAQSNPYKIGIDDKKKVLDIYADIAENDQYVAQWLNFMSLTPQYFESIGDLNNHLKNLVDKFIDLSSQTVGEKKIIIFSNQSLKSFELKETFIHYKGVSIQFYDKDAAIEELKSTQTIIKTYNTIKADNNSTIIGATIESNQYKRNQS